jgi:type II secretory ATPase GspE/PulE/Tfp pilus assembly ATPase PilB-like protein
MTKRKQTMDKESNRPETRSGKALAYLKNEMTDAERALFEEMLAESDDLREELAQARQMLDALSASSDGPIIRLAYAMIAGAIERGASDIHILPERRTVTVRFRLDGVLTDEPAWSLPKEQQQPLIDRWKVMADMNVGERRLPQDGRIPVKHDNKDYDLRVSVLPTLYGERVTARILYRSEVLMGLTNLGYTAAQVETLQRLARLPAGLILNSGRTGSGKTTLLYSLLKEMQSPGMPRRNILTVEDPIEYQLSGVSQTQVLKRAGLTFAAALRSILRSDPDVVMCAEMRNLETAELCIETALTGHLVLSSLHTTSALGLIDRLCNMGIETFLIADTLAGLVGQRLVRRIDARKMEEYEPAEEELERLGLTKADGPFQRGVPTEENGGTGFRGRLPLIEVVEVDGRLRRRIAEGVPGETLAAETFSPAWRTGGSLQDDARAKVKAGLTTVEEVNWALFDYPAA